MNFHIPAPETSKSTRKKRRLIKRTFPENPQTITPSGLEEDTPMFCMKREQSTVNKSVPELYILENSTEIDSTCKRMKTEKDMSSLVNEFQNMDLAKNKQSLLQTESKLPQSKSDFFKKDVFQQDGDNIFVLKQVKAEAMTRINRGRRNDIIK